ncbi:MAG: hypothetical protein K8J09_10385 [Planctomycetes bacterium]|nr:hypothetical protein [Planctomycetota bacterium]MCC7397285.1 hypothetical protein [Planctomycetota bacterium]
MTTATKTFPPLCRVFAAFAAGAVLAGLAAPTNAQAQPVPGDARIVRVYDLQQLLRRIDSGSTQPVAGDGDADGQPRAPVATQQPALESVATLVRAFVRPELASNEQVQTLGERWLVVLGRAEQQAWIDRFLQAAHQEQPVVARLCVDVVTMPEALFLMQVAPALAEGDEPAAAVTVLQPGAATSTFLDRLRTHPRATAVPTQVPPAGVALQALVPCAVAAVNQTAYVRDFKVEANRDSMVAEPVVDVVQDGFTLRATAQPLAAGLGVALHAVWSDLTKPIPTFTTTLGIGRPITIQLPQVQQVQIEAAVELPADNTVVLLLPPLLGRRCIAVLHVEQLVADRPKVRGR